MTAGERHASWLELFFDLVFVLAVAQVARILSGHTDETGLVRYIALFIPVWYSWIGFTFYADRFETDEVIYRVLIFAGMLSVIGFSLTLGNAFTTEGDPPLIICYILMRLVLVALYARAAYHVPLARPYCVQFIWGLSASFILLLISLLFEPPVRYAIWAVSLSLELATPFLNLKAARLIPIDFSHIPERFGLFTIIVLGEAVISAASGVSTVRWNFATIAAASIGFAMAACIWWINFEFVEENAVRSTSFIPRIVYFYGHFFIVASIVALGVGVEHAIKETMQSSLSFSTLALLVGGIAGYLMIITVIRLVTGVCNLVSVRLGAIVVSFLVLYAGQFLPPLMIAAALLALLFASIWIEDRYSEEGDEEKLPQLEPCEHAGEITVYKPRSEDGCEECRKNNYKWIHLRLCLGCGHVGCCDTSVNKHATKHFHESSHPIIASLEPGENWAWCYVDERFVPMAKPIDS